MVVRLSISKKLQSPACTELALSGKNGVRFTRNTARDVRRKYIPEENPRSGAPDRAQEINPEVRGQEGSSPNNREDTSEGWRRVAYTFSFSKLIP